MSEHDETPVKLLVICLITFDLPKQNPYQMIMSIQFWFQWDLDLVLVNLTTCLVHNKILRVEQ